jgi:hypothetical protein
MLLKELEILNCRKVKQAAISFHGPGLKVIQGINGSGKSTIVQALQLALEGPKAFTPGMITLGETQAEIVAITDDGVKIKTQISGTTVKQTVAKYDDTLNRYVAVSGGVRAFLEGIRSGFEMPWSMRDMADAKIIELMKEKCGISQKIAGIDTATAEKERLRTDVGRDKRRMGELKPMEKASHPPPIDDIQAERQNAREYVEWRRQQFIEASDYLRKKCTFASLEEIATFRKTVDEAHTTMMQCLAEREARIGKSYTQSDVDRLEKEVFAWNEKENKAKDYDNYLKRKKELDTLAAQYDTLTSEIDDLRAQRKKILANMKLVKGLEIGEDNLLYHNGVVRGITDSNKVANWSAAESVKVFFTMGAAFAGEFKVMVVDNAESLDEKTTKAISDWAESSEFLIILLKVATVPENLEDGIIYIQEGEILEKDGGRVGKTDEQQQ